MITKLSNYLFDEIADPRVKNWTLMRDAKWVFFIGCIYWFGLYATKKWMKNRQAFDLKNTILFYNLTQIVACSVLVYGLSTSGWTTHYSLTCQSPDYSHNKTALRMLDFVYYTFLVKIFDLVETFIFVFRKKFNQVSKLHVYHHTSTLFMSWLTCKYIGGGFPTFSIILNSCVHVVMYLYYLLASFGPEWQKKLSKWKPRMTTIQMTHMVVCIVHFSQSFRPDCDVPRFMGFIFVPNMMYIVYLFWVFYRANYLMNQKIIKRN